jgi:membrane protein required for colicin V production
MNFIDIILLVIIIWAAYKGFSKGLIIQAASLAALFLGVFGAIKFSGYTAYVLTEKLDFKGDYLQLTAFAITFVLIVIAVHFVARLTEKFFKVVALDFVNRILGLLFSTIKMAFIISIVLVIINTIDYRAPFLPREKVNKSLLYRPISALAPMIFPYFKMEYEKIKRDQQSTDEIIV